MIKLKRFLFKDNCHLSLQCTANGLSIFLWSRTVRGKSQMTSFDWRDQRGNTIFVRFEKGVIWVVIALCAFDDRQLSLAIKSSWALLSTWIVIQWDFNLKIQPELVIRIWIIMLKMIKTNLALFENIKKDCKWVDYNQKCS